MIPCHSRQPLFVCTFRLQKSISCSMRKTWYWYCPIKMVYWFHNKARTESAIQIHENKAGAIGNDKNTIHLPRQYLEKASKINDFMKHLGAYYTTTKPFEFRSEPWYDKENKKRVLLHYSRILMNILLWYELDRRFLPNSVGRQARFIFEDMHYRVLRI